MMGEDPSYTQVIYTIQSYALTGNHEKCFLQFKERVLCLQDKNGFLDLSLLPKTRHLNVNFKLLAIPSIFPCVSDVKCELYDRTNKLLEHYREN